MSDGQGKTKKKKRERRTGRRRRRGNMNDRPEERNERIMKKKE